MINQALNIAPSGNLLLETSRRSCCHIFPHAAISLSIVPCIAFPDLIALIAAAGNGTSLRRSR